MRCAWSLACVAIFLAAFTVGHAPPIPTGAPLPNCTSTDKYPQYKSYHIHIMFWPDGDGTWAPENPHNSKGALVLRNKFMEHFDLTNKPNCTSLYEPEDVLCAFPIDWRAGYGFAHPFLVPDFAFYVPTSRFTDTVPWMLRNREQYDVLVHPNSGCLRQDHTDHALWMGNKMQLLLPN